MLRTAAIFANHPAARALFALLGLVATSLFVLFGVDMLRVDPLAEPESFAIGACISLSLVGWWARVLLLSTTLHRWPVAKIGVAFCLCVGIFCVLYGFAFMPKGPAATPLLVALLICGVLMLLCTIGRPRHGPNNSSKPTPPRSAA